MASLIYAEKCGVTAAHFSSAIRRAIGYRPLAIITEIPCRKLEPL
ncbi:hypothetical protein [Bacteroides xylanisolvens]